MFTMTYSVTKTKCFQRRQVTSQLMGLLVRRCRQFITTLFYHKHMQDSYESTRETEKEALAAYSDIFLNLT